MEIILQSLVNEWEAFLRAAPRLVFALIVFALIVAIGRLAGRGLSLILAQADSPLTHREFFRKVVLWVFVFIGISIALNIIGLKGAAAGLLTGGGVTAVVLGFAFREIGENFLAGFFLAFSRPFRQGDLIRSGDIEGVVTGTEIRSTKIRTAEGSDIFIPSSQLFKSPLINYTLDGLRRLEFKVGIDYRDDPDVACKRILELIAHNKNVLPQPKPFAGISELAASCVIISVTFWLDTLNIDADIRQIRSDLMNQCRVALLEGGFTVSSEVTTAVNLAVPDRIPVEVSGR